MLRQSNSIERTKSSWTPINDRVANRQLFTERMKLLSHWHKAWSDSQRRDFITYCLGLCNEEELYYTDLLLGSVVPSENTDFTRVILRSLSLKIFSYLDPKSLCRAAQTSWYWNYLASDNAVWEIKCKSVGWHADISLPMNVLGFWKHFYAQKIHELRILPELAKNTPQDINTATDGKVESTHEDEAKHTPPPEKERTVTFIKHHTPNKVNVWKANDLKARDIEKKSSPDKLKRSKSHATNITSD